MQNNEVCAAQLGGSFHINHNVKAAAEEEKRLPFT